MRKDNRVAKLRSFIASRIDLSKAHILDVAGGKGEIAFQFLNLCNANTCHVVDPRPLSLSRFQYRLQRGFYHRSASVLMQDIVTQPGDPERPVGHLRCFFSRELWADHADDHADKDFENNCNETKSWSWPPRGKKNEHHISHDDEHGNGDTTNTAATQTPTFQHASAITKQANLIVGMHPDQAVDTIVDAALALDISFFVVPCCTYSQEFPHRRLENGKSVTKYEELLEYLQNKSSDIQREVLPFEGKNVCLYRVVR